MLPQTCPVVLRLLALRRTWRRWAQAAFNDSQAALEGRLAIKENMDLDRMPAHGRGGATSKEDTRKRASEECLTPDACESTPRRPHLSSRSSSQSSQRELSNVDHSQEGWQTTPASNSNSAFSSALNNSSRSCRELRHGKIQPGRSDECVAQTGCGSALSTHVKELSPSAELHAGGVSSSVSSATGGVSSAPGEPAVRALAATAAPSATAESEPHRVRAAAPFSESSKALESAESRWIQQEASPLTQPWFRSQQTVDRALSGGFLGSAYALSILFHLRSLDSRHGLVDYLPKRWNDESNSWDTCWVSICWRAKLVEWLIGLTNQLGSSSGEYCSSESLHLAVGYLDRCVHSYTSCFLRRDACFKLQLLLPPTRPCRRAVHALERATRLAPGLVSFGTSAHLSLSL